MDDIKELVIDIKSPETFVNNILDQIDEDSDWPLAVNPALIVDMNNYNECVNRGRNVVEMIVERDLYALNILDFGCGDGLVATEMFSRGASSVIGYDIQKHRFWRETEELTLTTDWSEVVSGAPYDFILLYDVIDHIMDEEPHQILSKLKNLLAKDGIITLRCHPWIARHGAHLYTQMNRAFLHVLFTQEQLERRGLNPTPTRKVVHPIFTYNKWIEKAGLKVVKEEKIVEPVEDYFTNNELLKSIIQKHYVDSHLKEYREGRGDLSKILSFHFVDYILKK